MSHPKHRQGAPPGIGFDPSFYPRMYAVSSQYKTYWIVAGFAFTVGFPSFLWQSQGMSALQKVLAALPIALLGGYLVLEAYRLKLILEPDAITVQRSFSSRRLLRCEIAGWRTGYGGKGTTTRILIPRDDGKKALKFPEIIQTDAAFFAWFAGIPDLNSSQSARGNRMSGLLIVAGIYFTAFGFSAFSYSRWDHARNRLIHPVFHPWAVVVGLLMIGLAYWSHVADQNPPKLPPANS